MSRKKRRKEKTTKKNSREISAEKMNAIQREALVSEERKKNEIVIVDRIHQQDSGAK